MQELIRIISKIEIKGPNLVKGISFEGQRVLGDPKTFVDYHTKNGADEIFIQDTVASLYDRSLDYEFIKHITQNINIPVILAGGLKTIDDIKMALRSGADKVAINSNAIKDINFLKDAVSVFGSQCIVSSIEAKRIQKNKYLLYYEYGRENSNIDLLEWINEICKIGVGEIILTSIDNDGTNKGFDLELGNLVNSICTMPLILSGGFYDHNNIVDAYRNFNLKNFAISKSINYHLLKDFNLSKKFILNYKQNLRKKDETDYGNKEFIKSLFKKKEKLDFSTLNISEIKTKLLESNLNIRI